MLDSLQQNIKTLFPFQLDKFQQDSINALNQGKSLVVCAPTGSGKTLIGEYAIYRALNLKQRVFYTTPLKALSNQKFRDFREKFAIQNEKIDESMVGLITGDTVLNANASIVIMTTEIFRNMLYETLIGQVGTSLDNVATVILDECHYISNRSRGTVWEESIIYCPPNIQLVALSATIGNPGELTEWINQVRTSFPNRNSEKNLISLCELVNSNFRPVPLRFYFSQKNGLFPLLNSQKSALNALLKSQEPKDKLKRIKREDCPDPLTVVKQLYQRKLLPSIYIIFSRRECDKAVQKLHDLNLVSPEEAHALQYNLLIFFLADSPNLQENLLRITASKNLALHKVLKDFLKNFNTHSLLFSYLAKNKDAKNYLFDILASLCNLVREDHLEPLTRGIAAHHAGILPAWKELVEQLFEAGLIKVVFATATLSAGINMPARTTVISALSKRTDNGHNMLTPSEFLQIAGRAGRRGMDKVGHVIINQTVFEGPSEAAYLATARPESLKSCFTPSYGMVLNLLQKHTIQETKNLLEKSFAEYLAKLKFKPEEQAIAYLNTEIKELDIKLKNFKEEDVLKYEALDTLLKKEKRLLKNLYDQDKNLCKKEVATQIKKIGPGKLLYLKSQRLNISSPCLSTVTLVLNLDQNINLLCLGENNYWYLAKKEEIISICKFSVPVTLVNKLKLPNIERFTSGKGPKEDYVCNEVHEVMNKYKASKITSQEINKQQDKIYGIEKSLKSIFPFNEEDTKQLFKFHYEKLKLNEKLDFKQIKIQRLQSNHLYYWQEFLNLIEVLQDLGALENYVPTLLGQATAALRGENELWLGIVFMSGILDNLCSHHLAALVSAIVTETLRPDTWTNYLPSSELLNIVSNCSKDEMNINKIYHLLNKIQKRYQIIIPIYLEFKFIGLVEQWALGEDWKNLCKNTSLDEGDLVRLLRRTIDLLSQIPQIPGLSDSLIRNAEKTVIQLKRFPV